jgi:hypothetical protein
MVTLALNVKVARFAAFVIDWLDGAAGVHDGRVLAL